MDGLSAAAASEAGKQASYYDKKYAVMIVAVF